MQPLLKEASKSDSTIQKFRNFLKNPEAVSVEKQHMNIEQAKGVQVKVEKEIQRQQAERAVKCQRILSNDENQFMDSIYAATNKVFQTSKLSISIDDKVAKLLRLQLDAAKEGLDAARASYQIAKSESVLGTLLQKYPVVNDVVNQSRSIISRFQKNLSQIYRSNGLADVADRLDQLDSDGYIPHYRSPEAEQ
ncbi:MAG: hypothetical protein ACRCXT_15530 [Paraclostridium sp.]